MSNPQREKLLTLRLAVVEAFGEQATDKHVSVLATRLIQFSPFATAQEFVEMARFEAMEMRTRYLQVVPAGVLSILDK